MSFICRIIIAALLCAPALLAQEQAATPPVVSVVVPVVGTVDGPNAVRWKTDVVLINNLPGEAVVSMMLPATPDQPVVVTTIAPGDRAEFTDVIGQAFGIESALSPLIVNTLGRRSITISATVYAVREEKTLSPQPIAVDYGPSYFPQRALDGLSFSDAYRTNLGLANLGEQSAEFVLALQRLPGRNVAVTHIVVPAATLVHRPVQELFPLITKGDAFSIVVETASEQTHVYASVIENATSTAKFVRGVPR
ncbi:MAG TPA: hypothetical protein VF698_14735 [Thermoanaerobaculia bacterium]|jgi:hypothetical protein